MENYNSNYLINSFGHEFNENFVENFHQNEQHQPKSQYEEIPLHGTLFGYDGLGGIPSNNQEENQWNHTGYLMSNFSNYFETQSPTPISNNMTIQATNSTQQYSLSTESLEFISNSNPNIVDQQIPPVIGNIGSEAPILHEKLTTQFSCKEDDCTKTYTTVSGLNNHMRKKHSGPASYHCDECVVTFTTTQQRTLHKIKEHNGRKYQASRYKSSLKEPTNTQKSGKPNDDQVHKCQSCDDTFNHKADLVRHLRNRHTGPGNGEYPCSKCSKVFFTYDMYNEHLSLHDSSIPKHTCNDCGKEFISQRKLKEHSIIHKERIMFKCEMCSKIFVRSQTLQYHRITCKAAFQCSKCVDSFMTAEALEKHKSFHEADTHTCLKCNKVFPTSHALTNHEKRHSLRMNYTCQICMESVSTRAKFQKHIKDHLESNLKCSVCNEEFQSLVKYGYHKAEMHGLMRPYDCLLCSDQFCTRHELFMHLHNHIDVDTCTYTCDLCGIKFSIKATFEQHKKSHSKNIEPLTSENTSINDVTTIDRKCDDVVLNFRCDLCSKSFEYKSLLTHHLSMEHVGKNLSQNFVTNNLPPISTKSRHREITCKADGCPMTFTTRKQLKNHMTIHKLATYECKNCKKIYHSRNVYDTHIRLCMPLCDDVLLVADEDMDSGPVECLLCNQLFENKKVLKFHGKFCNDEEKIDHKGDGEFNQGIEEIYLKTEVEDDFENLVPEF